jgi:hypothetical protein
MSSVIGGAVAAEGFEPLIAATFQRYPNLATMPLDRRFQIAIRAFADPRVELTLAAFASVAAFLPAGSRANNPS